MLQSHLNYFEFAYEGNFNDRQRPIRLRDVVGMCSFSCFKTAKHFLVCLVDCSKAFVEENALVLGTSREMRTGLFSRTNDCLEGTLQQDVNFRASDRNERVVVMIVGD
jgi:hypothetical protein